ncbi:MAG: hypothetical protein A2Z18_10185 [Armatimonadetes bacterium RBG_16_58_9]|nr:MAG: hypothetical protein A2Z18_10185 [Armatimonadetes bacterium RBG_16_58_9]
MTGQGLTGRDLRNAILFGALLYLAIRFISQIADILLIFSVTVIIVLLLNPPVSWLARHKVPRQASAAVIAVLAIGFVALGLYLIIPPASRQIQDLLEAFPKLADGMTAWLRRLATQHPNIARFLPRELAIDEKSVSQLAPALLGGASRVTASTLGAIVSILVVFITTIYAVSNPRPLAQGFRKAIGPAHRDRLEAAGARLHNQIRAWAGGIVLAMVFVFALTWIGLLIIGIKQAFLFALIAGLLEAVPIIGPVLSAVPPAVVALATGHPVQVIWIVIVFVIIQQIENHLLVPMIMSHQLSIHPVTIIFAVLVMGGLFGVIGVFLAAPAAVTAGILYDELYLRGFHRDHEHPSPDTSSTSEND